VIRRQQLSDHPESPGAFIETGRLAFPRLFVGVRLRLLVFEKQALDRTPQPHHRSRWFGTWSAALKAAGLGPAPVTRHSYQENGRYARLPSA
jgi:hypothetical protein